MRLSPRWEIARAISVTWIRLNTCPGLDQAPRRALAQPDERVAARTVDARQTQDGGRNGPFPAQFNPVSFGDDAPPRARRHGAAPGCLVNPSAIAISVDADRGQISDPFKRRHVVQNRRRGRPEDGVAILPRRDGDDHMGCGFKPLADRGRQFLPGELERLYSKVAKQGKPRSIAYGSRHRTPRARISRAQARALYPAPNRKTSTFSFLRRPFQILHRRLPFVPDRFVRFRRETPIARSQEILGRDQPRTRPIPPRRAPGPTRRPADFRKRPRGRARPNCPPRSDSCE